MDPPLSGVTFADQLFGFGPVTRLFVGCWLLAAGCWLLAVGCWLLAVACCLLLLKTLPARLRNKHGGGASDLHRAVPYSGGPVTYTGPGGALK